jgi:hypothetical protein
MLCLHDARRLRVSPKSEALNVTVGVLELILSRANQVTELCRQYAMGIQRVRLFCVLKVLYFRNTPGVARLSRAQ